MAAALEPEGLEDGSPAPTLRYLGDYELRGEIGRGAMGVVFRAWQTTLRRAVAVKILLGGSWASEAARQRFLTEARAAAALRDPRIVSIYEVGEQDDQPYFAMELVDGPNLETLRRREPVSDLRAAGWLADLAEAVSYAHENGVVHRDLKPSNVLIDADGRPKITDFGLAKIFDSTEVSGPGLTLTGNVLGTPGYMSPERVSGEGDDRAGDVYGLGAILYALLVGKPPHRGESAAETLHETLYGEIEPPRALLPEIPADLEAICLKCLEKEPRLRYGSAAELAADLRRFLADEPVSARPRGISARWIRRVKRSSWSVFLGGALGMAGLLFGLSSVLDRAPRMPSAESTDPREGERLLREAELHRRLGERTSALESLQRAAAVSPPGGVRREAMAVLEVPEIRHRQEWPVGIVRSWQVSDDEKTVAFLAQPERNGPLVLEGRSIGTGKSVFRISGSESPDTSPGWSGSLYPALPAEDGRIAEVFDPRTGQLFRIDLKAGEAKWLDRRPWIFERGGARSISRGSAGQLTEWDSDGGRGRDLGITGHPIAYLEDGRLVYALRGILFTVDPVDGARTSAAPADPVLAVAPGGRFALLDAPGTLEVWDLAEGGLVGAIDDRVSGPEHALLSADGSQVVLGSDNENEGLRVWQVRRPGRPTHLQPENDTRLFLAHGTFHPSGALLAVMAVDSDRPSIVVWDLTSSRRIARLLGQRSARWLEGGRLLMTTGTMREAEVVQEGTVQTTRQLDGLSLWDVASPPVRYRIRQPSRVGEPVSPIRAISMSSDGLRVAIDDTVWRMEKEPLRLRLERSISGRAVFAAGGELWRAELPPVPRARRGTMDALDSPAADPGVSTFQRLDPEGREIELRVEEPGWRDAAGNAGHPFAQALALVGHRAFVANWWLGGELGTAPESLGESLEMWDLVRGERSRVMSDRDMVRCLAVSPDGRWLAAGGQAEGGGLSLWDLENEERGPDLPHQTLPAAVAWAPDGRFVFSGGPVDTVDLTVLDGYEHHTWPADQDGVEALAVSSGGEMLASGGGNGEIVLWRSDGAELLRWSSGGGAVTALAFPPDTGVLISGSEDGRVTLWELAAISELMAEVGVPFERRFSDFGR